MECNFINYIHAPIIGALLLERLINKDSTVNPLIWAGIILNSSVTSFIYITLLKKTWPIIRQHMKIWRAIVTVFLFIGGLMSSSTLLHILSQAHDVVMETDLDHQWDVLFYFAAIARIIHCMLGVVFFSLVAPMSSLWAANLNDGLPRQLLALLPCKILLFFHWTVLIPTFYSTVDNYLVHAASFIYRTVGLVWIVLLTIYVIWCAANNMPNVAANEVQGEDAVQVEYEVPVEESGYSSGGSELVTLNKLYKPRVNTTLPEQQEHAWNMRSTMQPFQGSSPDVSCI